MKTRSLLALTGWLLVSPAQAQAPIENEHAQVWLDDVLAVSYRARVEGDWLVVEATHEPGWHTYAMDNVIRAREKTGKERPETELPTVITPLDGITLEGAWRQSAPLDLSTPDIRWYTWGFEGTSYFVIRVHEVTLPSTVQVDGQACTKDRCAMVDSLPVPVESIGGGPTSVEPASLVVVAEEDGRLDSALRPN